MILTRQVPALALAGAALLSAQTPAPFDVVEATISQVHEAMKAGRLTCRDLVGLYLKRIELYDKNGPAINAIVLVNPDAAKEAAELDRRFSQSGLTGPLHRMLSIGLQPDRAAEPRQQWLPALPWQAWAPIPEILSVGLPLTRRWRVSVPPWD